MIHACASIEPLETRCLLAHIGVDLHFGTLGAAPVDASVLVSDLPGGKLIAVGTQKVVRLNGDGSLDLSFVDAGAASQSGAIEGAALSGTRLLLVGHLNGSINQHYIRAIDAQTGAIDSTFDGDGTLSLTVPQISSQLSLVRTDLTSVIITSDSQLLLSFSQLQKSLSDPNDLLGGATLFKFDSDGTPDSGFGSNGALIVHSGEPGMMPLLTSLPGGEFLLVGEQTPHVSVLQRRDAGGNLVPAFGDQGTQVLQVGLGFLATYGQAVVQQDGKILIPGTGGSDTSVDAFIARLNSDGSTDTSYATDGTRVVGAARSVGALLDSAGRAVGAVADSLYRLLPDGTPDPDFDDDGFAPIKDQSSFTTLDLDADENILIGSANSVMRFVPADRVELGPDGRLRIEGTEQADTITATREGDQIIVSFNGDETRYDAADVVRFIINAYGGDDHIDVGLDVKTTVNGGNGDDLIRTGGMSDLIKGGSGDDTIDAGAGNDTILGGDGSNRIAGGDGDDSIKTGDGPDVIFGDAGDDSIKAGDGDDRVSGGAGRDHLWGQRGNDRLSGAKHGDAIDGGPGADTLVGGDGSDKFFTLDGNRDTVYGGLGVNTAWADPKLDRLLDAVLAA